MDAKSVVLFGAGASHGCRGVIPYAPPLGGGLYADLARRSVDWRGLPPDLRKEFEADFEQGMLSLVQQYSHSVGPLMRVMTEYFAGFNLDGSGTDLYSQLLNGMGTDLDDILFSSLNYECLFEIAASQRRLAIAYFSQDQSPPPGNVRLWKLHGSCNFRAPGIAVAPQGVSYAGSGLSFTPGALEAITPQEAINYVRTGGLYGAMCLYTVHKPIQIGTDVIQGLQDAWAGAVRAAQTVIVIGTRPHDEDKHLWEPMVETDAELHFVGSEDGFNEWVRRSGRPAAKSHFLGQRFEGAVHDVQRLLRP